MPLVQPPQTTPFDLECPTVCVVAWEYDSIPDEQWDNDPLQDWTRMLAKHGRVITLSSHAAAAIRRSMGDAFPVLVLPAPVGKLCGDPRGAREHTGQCRHHVDGQRLHLRFSAHGPAPG